MTTKLTFTPDHPEQDIFESYAFSRLGEEETAHFEIHLLICERCQDTLQETLEYIQLMKAGTAAYISRRQQAVHPRAPFRPQLLHWNLIAAAALLLTSLTTLLSWRTPQGEAQPIVMDAYRGAEIQAPAARPLDLKIDLKDVKIAAGYRVEIVDARGRRVWFGGTPARLTKGLSPGVYWVRLTTDAGEALREYGLTVAH